AEDGIRGFHVTGVQTCALPISPDLMDILGAASALPADTAGAPDEGGAGYLYRWAPLCGIYGGTLEVFRNMIAQHVLGLGRPAYRSEERRVGRVRRRTGQRVHQE